MAPGHFRFLPHAARSRVLRALPSLHDRDHITALRHRAGAGGTIGMTFPSNFSPVERAIWAQTWLALRAFRLNGQGGAA